MSSKDRLRQHGWEKQDEHTYQYRPSCDDGPTLVVATDDRAIRQYVRDPDIRGFAFLLVPHPSSDDQQITAVEHKSEKVLIEFALECQADFEGILAKEAEAERLTESVSETPVKGIATGWHSYGAALFDCLQAARYACDPLSYATIDDAVTETDIADVISHASSHVAAEIRAGLKRCRQGSQFTTLMDAATEILAFELSSELLPGSLSAWTSTLEDNDDIYESFLRHLQDMPASGEERSVPCTARQAELLLTQVSDAAPPDDHDQIPLHKRIGTCKKFPKVPQSELFAAYPTLVESAAGASQHPVHPKTQGKALLTAALSVHDAYLSAAQAERRLRGALVCVADGNERLAIQRSTQGAAIDHLEACNASWLFIQNWVGAYHCVHGADRSAALLTAAKNSWKTGLLSHYKASYRASLLDLFGFGSKDVQNMIEAMRPVIESSILDSGMDVLYICCGYTPPRPTRAAITPVPRKQKRRKRHK